MTEQIYYLRVSSLSHVEYCPMKSKIETFNKFRISNQVSNPIIIGNRLHFQYSYALTDFDRTIIRERLEYKKVRGAFQKQIGNVIIRGTPDDYRVISYNGKKYVSMIEVKTTTKKYLWNRELKAAMRQLQLYMWLVKEYIEELGYSYWKRGYVEVFSQNTGNLIRRVPVEYDENIEEWIYNVIDQFNGVAKMDVPPKQYCLLCPKVVKSLCNWNRLMVSKK